MDIIPVMTRLPDDLHKSLVVEAAKHCRSMNAEIIKRLQESFIGKPRVRVKALTEETRGK